MQNSGDMYFQKHQTILGSVFITAFIETFILTLSYIGNTKGSLNLDLILFCATFIPFHLLPIVIYGCYLLLDLATTNSFIKNQHEVLSKIKSITETIRNLPYDMLFGDYEN